ncbi:MAG TPA: helix-turn-helix transcriptional regulator [Acholeplasmataceae bacterium]|jgi:transcriptional regulator with XRE-family HTH domain|nr:helix-turn-helix transcriptional regulator [Acholeplasmataceae bacterium]
MSTNNNNKENVFEITRFGINLARLRKAHDMTQSELADKLNLTRQAISRYENGDSFPDISILVLICEIFDVALVDLIGVKTTGEKNILKQVLNGEEIKINAESTVDDLINLAPILKPSILEKAVKDFQLQGINIEAITNLVQYINDKTLYHLLQNANYESPSSELLTILLPYMDDESKWAVFAKILEGKVDYQFLEQFIPACQWIDLSLIEAAVVEGVLNEEALMFMQKGAQERYRRRATSILWR